MAATAVLGETLELYGQVQDVDRVIQLLLYDGEVHMPQAGAAGRGRQVGTLRGLAQELLTGERMRDLVAELERATAGDDYASPGRSAARILRHDIEAQSGVPPELLSRLSDSIAAARIAWRNARAASDWSAFAPALRRNLDLHRELAEAIGYRDHPYDALLDRVEPEITTADLRTLFEQLRGAILPLAARVRQRPAIEGLPPAAILVARQLEFANSVVAQLGYDFARGRQDISTHPFSVSFGPGDVRVTTRTRPDDLLYCLYPLIHEAGHAIYYQGVDPALDRTPMYRGSSSGIHESQSRLWENLVGRGRPFCRWLAGRLAAEFPEHFAGLDPERLYRAVNRVGSGSIRVDADELTYNLHIALRFEIELELFEGRLDVDGVPEAWRARSLEYFGVEPEDAAHGPLQDIHWAAGSFAGFPSYTLGNLAGAQLMEVARRAVPDLDQRAEAGDWSGLLAWLRENVHRGGRTYTPNELLERVTGRALTAQPWIDYVTAKFTELYDL